ncbi:HtaA domain-containing protein [Arthrobacter sp. Helios]|uniref:HtaA domain-containing protein n=1 Tax=Arthrobacter sp. Helios TaxID=2828862 RepID=UPI0020515B42|nr:HtaA domain-containing protein [Arthrobacter sp. Helios]UPO76993.1 HtaA domain-containing protein [Arthrobacter sp. Helios]
MTFTAPAPARRLLALLLTLALALGTLLALPSIANAVGPSTTVTPGYAGGTVTVSGTGFAAASPGIYVAVAPAGASGFYASGAAQSSTVWVAPGNEATAATAPMGADGSFSVNVPLPAGGDLAVYTSKAHGQGFADKSQDTITSVQVLPAPSVTVAPVSEAGGTLTVTGSGFYPDSTGAYVALGDAATTTIDRTNRTAQWLRLGNGLNADGTFTATFEVGARSATGDLYVLTSRGHLLTDIDLSTRTPVAYTAAPEPSPTPTDTPTTPAPTPTDTPSTPAPTPTDTPTTPAPTPTDTPTTPAPTPTDTPSTPAAGNIQGATLQWGFKSSFISYLKYGAAGGWALSDGVREANGIFSWSNGSGSINAAGVGRVSFPGSVRFTGHAGALDLTFSQFAVNLTSANRGTLQALVSNNAGGAAALTRAGGAIDLVDLDLTGANLTAGSFSLAGAKATLTAAGAAAFNGMYAAGTVMDPVTAAGAGVVVPPVVQVPGTTPTTPGASVPTETGPAAVVPAGTTEKTPEPRFTTVCTSNVVQGATLAWGVKSSFRSYLTSAIANGGWSLSGVSESAGTFGFGSGTGTYASGSRTGTVGYPGTINFSGHDGTLNLTLSGIRIQQTGPSSGVLIATVDSSDMDGNKQSHGAVQFATLDLSGASVTSQAVSVSGAPAILTAAGAAAFAGFYPAGAALDPVSFTFPLGAETDCSQVLVDADGNPIGSLASTGASGTSVMLGSAALALLLGVGLTIVAARRNRGAHA